MIVLAISFCLYLLYKDTSQLSQKNKIWVRVVLLVYCMISFMYNGFLESCGWQYGIPGADMEAHFFAAKDLGKGVGWGTLSLYGERFAYISINTIGYFLYAEVLSKLLYWPVIFDVKINIYLVYVMQAVIAVDALVKFSNSFSLLKRDIEWCNTFLLLSACATFAISAGQLMRDIYVIWFIVVIFEQIIKFNILCDECSSKDSFATGFWMRIFALAIMAILFRFYSAMIFVPLLLFYGGYLRLGIASSAGLTCFILFGTTIIDAIRESLSVSWLFEGVDFSEAIRFLLFPNVINQIEYIKDWQLYFGFYDYLGGVNVPGVLLAMGIWNLFVFPLIFFGFFGTLRSSYKENVLWFSILLNVVFLYSLVYEQIDTRHRLFMCLPMAFLASKGIAWLNGKRKVYIKLYSITILYIILMLFLVM